MSGIMDLEDDTTPAVAAAPVAEPAAVETPVAVEAPPDPDEAEALEVQGGRYVPLPALRAAREENRALKAQAVDTDQLRQQIAQLQGNLETYQQLQRQPQQPAPVQTAPVADNPKLVKLARQMDYYKPDGAPDLDRAAVHLAQIREEATEIAQQLVQPLQQNAAQQQSAANYHNALRTVTPSGQKPKADTLTWMWRNLPAEYTADPRVAQVLPALALGLDALQGGSLPPQPLPPANAPLVTEASGNVPRSRTVITDTERAVLANRGITDDKYSKLTKDFRPGRTSTLED